MRRYIAVGYFERYKRVTHATARDNTKECFNNLLMDNGIEPYVTFNEVTFRKLLKAERYYDIFDIISRQTSDKRKRDIVFDYVVSHIEDMDMDMKLI